MLSDRQWRIAIWAWLIGIFGFPAAVGFGVQIPPIAYMGYSSLCLVITANHPKIVQLLKAAQEDDDSKGKD